MTPPSQSLAEGLVLALAAAGVRDVVYCPGSRSAPLAHALHRAESAGHLRVRVRLDERAAAFVAVGLSRAGALCPPDTLDEGGAAPLAGAPARSGSAPVAVVTTSGGAVAELHAGVAEASHSGIPLVVVSADRPFEMRGVGASQTTTQPGIFASHVRATWDVPAGTPADRRLDALVARAVATALGRPSGAPGPVHLNVGFRDPLVPDLASALPDLPSLPLVLPVRPAPTPWEDAVRAEPATLVLAGDGADPAAGEWARAAGLPLLAEPSSGLTPDPAWIPHEQSLLAAPALAGAVRQVVLTGRPTLSRPVSALLSRDDVRIVVQSVGPGWVDVAGTAAVVVPALTTARHPAGDGRWGARWRAAADLVTTHLGGPALVDEGAAPTLLSAARAVWEEASGTLLLGASNSVRAVDLVAGAPGRPRVVANRGLAGIDGTVATALGLAWGSGGAVCALMGDLTFLHDASALTMTEGEEEPDVCLVVLDDHGGSIFASLEQGAPALADRYERWFATSQSASVEGLTRASGARYLGVETLGELRRALKEAGRGRVVVHVRVARDPEALAAVRDCAHDAP